jgi:light-regulated signal transduction histidine kinase (bacteriophytochrome)
MTPPDSPKHSETAMRRVTAEALYDLEAECRRQVWGADSVEGEAGLLRVVMENLLCNAWKFTSKEPEAEVEFGVLEQGGKPVYFVRDNGSGFEAAHAERIFDPFQRLHGEDEFEGTGVGLATVARIIRRQGGHLWAQGQTGMGATFYFAF